REERDEGNHAEAPALGAVPHLPRMAVPEGDRAQDEREGVDHERPLEEHGVGRLGLVVRDEKERGDGRAREKREEERAPPHQRARARVTRPSTTSGAQGVPVPRGPALPRSRPRRAPWPSPARSRWRAGSARAPSTRSRRKAPRREAGSRTRTRRREA